jgi:hypothetical protein
VDFFFQVKDQEQRISRVIQGKNDDKSKRRKPTPLSAQTYLPMNDMNSFWKLRNCESPSHIGWGNANGKANKRTRFVFVYFFVFKDWLG